MCHKTKPNQTNLLNIKDNRSVLHKRIVFNCIILEHAELSSFAEATSLGEAQTWIQDSDHDPT